MTPTPNPIAPGESDDDGPDLDEQADPAEPHPDEPTLEGPAGAIAGDAPDTLSEIGEPHPDEPGVTGLEDAGPSGEFDAGRGPGEDLTSAQDRPDASQEERS